MLGGRIPIASAAAAAILAFLTLTVFFLAKDQGPISTVRRFQEGVLRRDGNAVRSALGPYVSQSSTELLVNEVAGLFQSGYASSVAAKRQAGSRAYIAVVFKKPTNAESYVIIPYVLERGRTPWVINPNETWMSLQRQSMVP